MAEETKSKRFNFWGAFKNVAIIFSFTVNFILVLVLLLSPGPLLMAKADIVEPLLGDLDKAFVHLGETNIAADVPVSTTMPVSFTLPLAQTTDVILAAPVPLYMPATFSLPGGGGTINGTVSLNLPQGMLLPVSLNLAVPVSTTIPVVINVPVDLNLSEAGMRPAIDELRAVLGPLYTKLQSIPDTPKEILNPQ